MSSQALLGVEEFLKKSRGCRKISDVARALGVTSARIYQWHNGHSPKRISWKRIASRLSTNGRSDVLKQIIPMVMKACGMKSQAELAHALGVTEVTISNWTNGRNKPQPGKLRRLLGLDTEKLVERLVEFEPITPTRRHLDSEKDKEKKLADKLKGKRGLYIFYDSAGRVIYVGKSAMGKNHDLLAEAKQRLGAGTKRSFYEPTRKGVAIVGKMARYLSAYEVRNRYAIHKLESLLLRAFPNDHGNKNTGRL